LNSGIRVGLPWPSLLAFLRIVTNPKAYERPDKMDSAWKQVEHWLSWPTVWIPEPTDRHPMVLAALLQRLGGGHNLVPDAHLAGIAIEHGLTLCSADGDFARFAGLKWVNPLV
jgi:toxin-antitoxin system PIN domain toxin